LREPATPRAPRDRVRASSFSQLAASGKLSLHASVDDAIDLDAADEGLEAPEPVAETGPRIALADFPTGSVRGRLIHSIYENISFQAPSGLAIEPQVAQALASYGMEASARELLSRAIVRTLITPVDPQGLPSLASLAAIDRLAELEFVFPVAHAAISGERPAPLRVSTLSSMLLKHAESAAEREYAARVSGLTFSALHGYLRGFIDLVARHDGRYYVLDYKSNHLGPHASDYTHTQMQAAMFEHHYVLQYLLYSVAVHRHLSLRVPDYDYERHFGGVYYLFVRGMAPEHAGGTGVYRARPSHALVSELSEALRDPAGAA
jgi:exodeoxyribonuclease V beta subunit